MAGLDWLRLWHDMPNDPKWRTVARASGQPIALVIATYLHMLVDASRGVTQCHDASRSVTRGVTDVTNEDIASALDVEEGAISAIREAMQGRVLDGDRLTGWDKRQPKREDSGNPETGAKSSAQRKREQRERERADRRTDEGHDMSRDVTQGHDREEESREELTTTTTTPNGVVVDSAPADDLIGDAGGNKQPKAACPHQEIIALYHELLPMGRAVRDWTPARSSHLRTRWNEDPKRQNLDYWRRFFGYVANSPFLTGKVTPRDGRKPFLVSLDWIVKAENFAKIREGQYHEEAAA
ncbi:hypothetical protein [Cupriavidus sp. a3]|uniref:hypothetical protein n=1 Tax=Cupriavidus sp. a3 TaxID=3242158 RepID=UPI003D9C4001